MAGKKGKKSKSDGERRGTEQPSEREIVARIELEKLNDELQSVKSEVRLPAWMGSRLVRGGDNLLHYPNLICVT